MRVVGEPRGDRRPDLRPDGGPGGEQAVEGATGEQLGVGGQQRGGCGAEIEHVLADGDADPGRSSVVKLP